MSAKKKLVSAAMVLDIVRKIERVPRTEPHTLVVKQGGASACLRFNETIQASDLLTYVHDQMNWQVKNLPFVVDGVRYNAVEAPYVAIAPATKRVAVGQKAPRPVVFEITRDVGAKG